MHKVDIVQQFRSRAKHWEGSGFIATEKFLRKLLPYLGESKILVDYGAGIGTISAFALLANPKMEILAIEENDWCKNQFEKNVLVSNSKSTKLINSLSELSESDTPRQAMWVIDVGQTEKDVERILASSFSSIWIEGHRYGQRREFFEKALNLEVGLTYKSFLGDSRSPKGGCQFMNAPFSRTRKIIMKLQLFRMLTVIKLKLSIIEWEVRTRILNSKTKN